MEEESKKKEVQDKGIEKTEEIINKLLDEGIQPDNLDDLYKLVDIHKDFKNEIYWKNKEENMRYSNYGNYNEGGYGEGSYGRRGVTGTGRGRYREGGSYGRRYSGEEALNDMYEGYGDYMESGSYGGPETMKALKYMLKSAEQFFKHIQEEAQSPEEIELVKETAKKISEM